MITRSSYREKINNVETELEKTRRELYGLNNTGRLSLEKARELEGKIEVLEVHLIAEKNSLSRAEKNGVFADEDLEILKVEAQVESLKFKNPNCADIGVLLNKIKELR